MGDSVALAALAIVATLCGALIWLLKALFGQNAGTLKTNVDALNRNSDVIAKLTKSLEQRDSENKEFHTKVMKEFRDQAQILKTISDKQDQLLEGKPQNERSE